MEKQFSTPILLIVFNRPFETKNVLDAIAPLKPSRLFVAADGPRDGNTNDVIKGKEVRELINSYISWPCDLQVLFRDENLGCGVAPANAYDWFFSKVEEGIILEDDCVPSQSFFLYCETLLDKHRNDKRIFSINGNNFGYTYTGSESYFLGRFMNPCGWATWKRSYDLVDYKLSGWDGVKNKELFLHKRLNSFFDFDLGWIKYWRDIFNSTTEKIKIGKNVTYWDYQWMYAQLYNKQYSIVPAKNLITNIGYNENGTHITDAKDPLSNLPAYELSFPLKHCSISNAAIDKVFEKNFVKKLWCYQKSRRGIFFYAKMAIAKYLEKWTKKSI